MAQFDAEEGGLERVEPAVVARDLVDVFDFGAVVAQPAQARGELGVVGGDRAAVAEGAEVLAGIEAPGDGVAMGAEALALIAGAMGLGGVLDDPQAMAAGDGEDGVQVGGLAVEVHRDQGAGAGGDGGRDACRVNVKGARVRLHRDRGGAGLGHRQPGGNEGVGGDDDLVAGADVAGAQGEMQGVQTAGDADAMGRAAVGGPVGLKALHLFAEDVPAGRHDAAVGGVEIGLQLLVGGMEVEEGDGHRAVVARRGHAAPQRARMNSA